MYLVDKKNEPPGFWRAHIPVPAPPVPARLPAAPPPGVAVGVRIRPQADTKEHAHWCAAGSPCIVPFELFLDIQNIATLQLLLFGVGTWGCKGLCMKNDPKKFALK